MSVEGRSLDAAVRALTEGQVVIFPTDTVYGMGVAVGPSQNLDALYDIKKRDMGKPIAWLIGSPSALTKYGSRVPEYAIILARKYWPGALTLVVKASENVPPAFQSNQGTIGLRMPDNHSALKLINTCGFPLATTSANMSGEEAPNSVQNVDPELKRKLVTLADDSSKPTGISSTVVDCTASSPRVIRQGAVCVSDLFDI